MKYRKKLCPSCNNGLMVIQHGRRGYYYRCMSCGHTANIPPTYTIIPESHCGNPELIVLDFPGAKRDDRYVETG
jgi:ribosomal protein S27AE